MLVYKDWRQQREYTCGPTCVRIACAALGARYTEVFLEERLLCTQQEGTEPHNIAAFLRSESFGVLDGNMEVSDLDYFSRNHKPVIALCNNHYVLVAKVFRGSVYFHDPNEGPRKLKIENFQNYWHCESYLGAKYPAWGLAIWRDQG
jgi:ABC-type bacteriocin/lantibiotic exporter with double-glycine peptidase domain